LRQWAASIICVACGEKYLKKSVFRVWPLASFRRPLRGGRTHRTCGGLDHLRPWAQAPGREGYESHSNPRESVHSQEHVSCIACKKMIDFGFCLVISIVA
jgi:hypothetical protein